MQIFISVMLPVLLIFGFGYGIQKWKRLDITSISTVALYVLIPCLVFNTIYKANLDKTYVQMVIFSFILLATLVLINKVYSRIKNHTASMENGLILSTAFMNAGNYGTPIILFAFGEEAFALAVIFMVLQQIIMNFFGVYYAAKGKEGILAAIKSVFEMPPTYALFAALVLNLSNITIGENLLSVIALVGDAAIPLVMVVLGMQLANLKLKEFQWSEISYGITTRMILSPIVAYVITVFIMDVDPLLRKVLIVASAMPSAATMVLFALQYKTEPNLVSSITLVSTVVSVFTITVLLNVVH
ncbi:AEC family transporter [Alkalihalobacillus sp. R86527]|uniref:AEC family transporter n=1 Tax=Alkalihalobacillus sp. R86527 TaxID=3093863 RepID=UPI00366BE7CA